MYENSPIGVESPLLRPRKQDVCFGGHKYVFSQNGNLIGFTSPSDLNDVKQTPLVKSFIKDDNYLTFEFGEKFRYYAFRYLCENYLVDISSEGIIYVSDFLGGCIHLYPRADSAKICSNSSYIEFDEAIYGLLSFLKYDAEFKQLLDKFN